MDQRGRSSWVGWRRSCRGLFQRRASSRGVARVAVSGLDHWCERQKRNRVLCDTVGGERSLQGEPGFGRLAAILPTHSLEAWRLTWNVVLFPLALLLVVRVRLYWLQVCLPSRFRWLWPNPALALVRSRHLRPAPSTRVRIRRSAQSAGSSLSKTYSLASRRSVLVARPPTRMRSWLASTARSSRSMPASSSPEPS